MIESLGTSLDNKITKQQQRKWAEVIELEIANQLFKYFCWFWFSLLEN